MTNELKPEEMKPVELKIKVALTANGFVGYFVLSENHFNELLAWLVERSQPVKP